MNIDRCYRCRQSLLLLYSIIILHSEVCNSKSDPNMFLAAHAHHFKSIHQAHVYSQGLSQENMGGRVLLSWFPTCCAEYDLCFWHGQQESVPLDHNSNSEELITASDLAVSSFQIKSCTCFKTTIQGRLRFVVTNFSSASFSSPLLLLAKEFYIGISFSNCLIYR